MRSDGFFLFRSQANVEPDGPAPTKSETQLSTHFLHFSPSLKIDERIRAPRQRVSGRGTLTDDNHVINAFLIEMRRVLPDCCARNLFRKIRTRRFVALPRDAEQHNRERSDDRPKKREGYEREEHLDEPDPGNVDFGFQ